MQEWLKIAFERRVANRSLKYALYGRNRVDHDQPRRQYSEWIHNRCPIRPDRTNRYGALRCLYVLERWSDS